MSLILQSANKGATKTRIMYASYLSYAQVKEYLSFLQTKGLLMYEEGSALYRLTEKGLQFLSACDEMNELVAGAPEDAATQVAPIKVAPKKAALQF
jgi:predicted transcriptional regulator